MKSEETKQIFERMATGYDTQERIAGAKIVSDQLRIHGIGGAGTTAIDYGAGTGLIGLALADLFDTLLLVDTSPQMVKQIEQKIAAEKITNAQVLCQDFAPSIPDSLQADVIFMSQVLLHVKDTNRLLTHLYQLLKKNGQLLIVDFDKNEKIVSDKVHNGFDQEELGNLLKTIGFTTVESRTFYHGEKNFMNQDASLFLMDGTK